MRFVLSFIKVLKMSRLFRQDQDQDFYFKTKTKTIFHVHEVPRDQDQGLETTSLDSDGEDCCILVMLFYLFPTTDFSTSLGRFLRNFATRRGVF